MSPYKSIFLCSDLVEESELLVNSSECSLTENEALIHFKQIIDAAYYMHKKTHIT